MKAVELEEDDPKYNHFEHIINEAYRLKDESKSDSDQQATEHKATGSD